MSEKVIHLDLGTEPEAAVSGALLLQSEYKTFLIFNFGGPNRKPWPMLEKAIFEFNRCSKTKFGHPNDEALEGHPLYKKGFNAYGIYEVINSTWIEEIAEQNRVRFPNSTYSKTRHFAFAFHDSTFECVARDFEFEISEEPIEAIWARLTEQIFKY